MKVSTPTLDALLLLRREIVDHGDTSGDLLSLIDRSIKRAVENRDEQYFSFLPIAGIVDLRRSDFRAVVWARDESTLFTTFVPALDKTGFGRPVASIKDKEVIDFKNPHAFPCCIFYKIDSSTEVASWIVRDDDRMKTESEVFFFLPKSQQREMIVSAAEMNLPPK